MQHHPCLTEVSAAKIDMIVDNRTHAVSEEQERSRRSKRRWLSDLLIDQLTQNICFAGKLGNVNSCLGSESLDGHSTFTFARLVVFADLNCNRSVSLRTFVPAFESHLAAYF